MWGAGGDCRLCLGVGGCTAWATSGGVCGLTHLMTAAYISGRSLSD